MKLPEEVNAFFLLNAANVSEETEKLAQATVGDLIYDNMKTKIQNIFGDPNASVCVCVTDSPKKLLDRLGWNLHTMPVYVSCLSWATFFPRS